VCVCVAESGDYVSELTAVSGTDYVTRCAAVLPKHTDTGQLRAIASLHHRLTYVRTCM